MNKSDHIDQHYTHSGEMQHNNEIGWYLLCKHKHSPLKLIVTASETIALGWTIGVKTLKKSEQ